MAVGRRSDIRGLVGLLLLVNLVLYLVILGLASWFYDDYIDGRNEPFFGVLVGNPLTNFKLVFALLGGAIGVCSVIAGLMHHRAWSSESLATAASTGTIAWATMAIAFGIVCKEINMGGNRGRKVQTLEAFIIISTFSELLYLVLLHAGMFSGTRYGPDYN